MIHLFDECVREISSRLSCSPSPSVAQADWINHCLCFYIGSPTFAHVLEPDPDFAALLPLLLPLLFCNCCLLIPSAVFLGAPPSLNCHCADASFTIYATKDVSSSLPLLSFVTPFAVSTHLHDFSDSSYQHFNLIPCLSLRQVFCQILFAWDSPHFYSSRLGHILQPQIPQLHVSSLSETSSRHYCFHSVGVSPDSHLGGHAQVCHHRLHSKSLSFTRNDSVILGFRRAQRTRRLRSGPMFHHCAVDHHHSSTRRLPLGPLGPIRIHMHVHVHLIVMSPGSHHPRHFLYTCQIPACLLQPLPTASSEIRHPRAPTCPSSCSSTSTPNF